MTSAGVVLRRALLMVMLAAGVASVLSWRRRHGASAEPIAPPQWPTWPERPRTSEPTPAEHPPEEPRVSGDEPGWVPPNPDGSAPVTHPVKLKESSGIFHVPGGRFYDRTQPDRCYPTAAAAEADGYRQSKT